MLDIQIDKQTENQQTKTDLSDKKQTFLTNIVAQSLQH